MASETLTAPSSVPMIHDGKYFLLQVGDPVIVTQFAKKRNGQKGKILLLELKKATIKFDDGTTEEFLPTHLHREQKILR